MRLALAAAVAALLLAAAPARAARPLGLPEGQAVLFTVQAEGGTLAPVRGQKGRFTLTLRNVASQGLWFTDRPARETGGLRIGAFFAAWRQLGFRAEPPNAVISLTGARDGADAFAVELGTPRYDARTDIVRVGVRALDQVTAGVSQLGPDLDEAIPARFGEVALFIDDVVIIARGLYPSCNYIAQLDIFPSSLSTVAAYFPANGQLQLIARYSALFSLLGSTFGGDGNNTFGIPLVAGPIDFLGYQLCVNGIYSVRADDDYDGNAQCDVGSIVLGAMRFQPAGWVAADGRSLSVTRAAKLFAVLGTTFGGDGKATFKVPKIPAPKGMTFWVCANGDAWKPGTQGSNQCAYSQVVLFATTKPPSNYLPADGRVLSIDRNQILYFLLGTYFGGDGINTFALPNVPPPVPGTAYAVCSNGYYPSRS